MSEKNSRCSSIENLIGNLLFSATIVSFASFVVGFVVGIVYGESAFIMSVLKSSAVVGIISFVFLLVWAELVKLTKGD